MSLESQTRNRYNREQVVCISRAILSTKATFIYFLLSERAYIQMKLNGTYKFKASGTQVFNAILNPEVLKASIPGCNSVEYLDTNRLKVNVTTPLPGLKGPYGIVITIAQQEAPNYLELQVQRKGTGGSINAVSKIKLTDQPDGTLLTYDTNAELEGAVAMANNPIGQGITKNSLNTFFKNLQKAIA
jgi:hypothetical protein